MKFIKKLMMILFTICLAGNVTAQLHAADEAKQSNMVVEFLSNHKYAVAGVAAVGVGIYLFKKYGFASSERAKKLNEDIDKLGVKVKADKELATENRNLAQDIFTIAQKHEVSTQELMTLLKAKGFTVACAIKSGAMAVLQQGVNLVQNQLNPNNLN